MSDGWPVTAHRITGVAPKLVRVVQKDFDDDRHHLAHDVVGIAQLLAVDRTVPGGTAVDQLVEQGVEPLEDDAQHRAGVVVGQCGMRRLASRGEALLPVVAAGQAILVVPVGLEDVAVVEQQSDRTSVTPPDQTVEVIVTVQPPQPLQEITQSRPWATRISPRSLA